MDRRRFIAGSLSALLAGRARAAFTPKRVLVLGGTLFLGRALVDALVSDGQVVTLFNRGITHPELFPNLEKLKGFRSADPNDQDLTALLHRRFDAVVDVWPNDPDVVASAAQAFKDRTQHYLFVSSVGAYDAKEFAKPVIREDALLQPWDAPGRSYNRNKAESERRLQRIFGDRLTIVRPGAIKGRGDDTPDLLTWLVRLRSGGEHIAPGDGSDPVALVDVKDVARFLASAVRSSLRGTFNVAGSTMTFRTYLEACRSAAGSDAKLTWIPQTFLHQHGLEPDAALHTYAGNFPSWEPDARYQGLYRVSNEKALGTGWRTRPFDETAFDCLTDYYALRALEPSRYLTAEKEKEVLEAWARRSTDRL